MGPLSFQPLFPLASAHWGFWIVILKTTVRIFCRCVVFCWNVSLSISDIDYWIKRFVVLEHAVKDALHGLGRAFTDVITS